MFDSVLNRGNVAKSRFGTGAFFSAGVHVALLGLTIYISSRPVEKKEKDVSVTFVQAAAPPPPADAPPPPPPPPPPPKRRSSTPRVEKVDVTQEVVKKPDTIVEAKEEAAEKPVDVAEVTPAGGGDDDDGVEGGVEGGVKGGVVGGVIGGKVGSTTPIPPQNVVIPFGAGMNRPSMTSGRDPTYTKEALAARVEGLMIVRCTINVTGAITNCRVIKEVPHMKQAVLDALYSRRYTPVLFNGQPVNVDYVFNIKLVLPSR
jgi:protein TonB